MSMHKYRSILTSAVCLLTFAAVSPAFASNDAMLQLLKELRDNGTLSPEAYELIKNSAEADNEKTVAKIEEVKEETKAAAAAAS
ncbi:MAG: hypothetical protein MI741_20055, partial [Rhodospirillales bacterium]|nr:hypothetical protein [Rhodospirillales bacterium]